ncbi:hypothetical protein VaNZ11_002220 [Volvox africanus]|uniref:Uncharacterized protein n=1 Tax=Volvox africanus TaxID=51714 RepID=A0ABQ5RS57_9CHLO|nr:hypothetical protein VaNZ11_002220 [Volvox africanus]
MRPESGFRNVSSDGVLQEMQVDVQQRPRLGRGRYLPRGVLDMECHPRLSYLRLSRPCEHSTTSRPVADSPGVLPLSATRTGNSKVALPTHPPDTLLTLDRKHCNMGQHDMASFGNMRVKALGHTPKTQPSELTMRASGIQQAATGNRSEATDTRSPSAIITTVIPTNAHPKAEVHLGRHDSCPPGLHLLTTPSDRNYGGSSNDSPNSNAHAAIITHSRVEPRPAKYPRLTGPMLMAPNPWATGSPPPLLIPPLAPGASIARPLPPVTTGVPTMYVQSNPPMWVSAARDPSGKYPQQLVDPTSTPALLNIGPLSVGGSGGDGAGGSGNGDGNGSGGGDGDGGGGSAGNGDTSTRSAGIASGGAVVAAISGGGRTCSSDPQYLLQGTPAGRSMETGPTCGTALAKIIAAVLAETLIVPSIADSIALAATASAGSSAVLGTEAANAAATLAHEATGAVASVAGAPAAVPAAPAVPARVAALPVACGYHSGGANSVGVRLKDQGRGGDGSSDGGSGRGGRAGGGHGSGDDGGDGGRNQVEVAVQASGRNDGSRISGSSSGHGCEYGGGGGSQAPPDADLMAMATDLAAHGRELVSRLVRVQATRQRLIQMEEMLTGQIQQARHMLLSVLDQQQQLVKQLPVQRPEQQPGKTLIQEQLRMRTQPPPPPLQQQQKQQPQQQQQRDENLPNLQLTKPQRKRSQSAELRCQAPQVLKQWRDEGPQLTAATAASIVEAAMEAGAAERALLQPSSEARAAAEMAEDMTTMPMHISQPATRPLATMAAGTSGLSVAGRSSSGGPVVPPPQRVQREQQHQTGPLPEAQQQQPHNVMQQLRQPAQQYLQQPKQQQQSVPGRPKQQQHPLELGDSWQQPQQQEDDIPLFVDCKDFKAYMADEERKSTEAAESLIQLGKLLPLPRLELQQPAAALSSRDVLKQQQPRPSPPQPQQDRQQKSTWSSPSSRRSQQPQQQLSSALPSPAGPAPGTQRPPLLPQAAYHNRQRQQQPRQQPQQWSQRQCPQTQALIAAATVHQSASTAAAAVAAAQLQTNPIVCGVGSPDNCRPGWATKDKRTVVAAGKPAPLCDDVNHDDALPHCPTSSAGAGAVVATAAVGTSSGNLRSTTAMTAASSRGAVAAGPSCTGASGTKWAAKSNEAERDDPAACSCRLSDYAAGTSTDGGTGTAAAAACDCGSDARTCSTPPGGTSGISRDT